MINSKGSIIPLKAFLAYSVERKEDCIHDLTAIKLNGHKAKTGYHLSNSRWPSKPEMLKRAEDYINILHSDIVIIRGPLDIWTSLCVGVSVGLKKKTLLIGSPGGGEGFLDLPEIEKHDTWAEVRDIYFPILAKLREERKKGYERRSRRRKIRIQERWRKKDALLKQLEESTF